MVLPQHITLTGFSGTGKSTIAGLVAVRLGWRAIDADDYIEEQRAQLMAGSPNRAAGTGVRARPGRAWNRTVALRNRPGVRWLHRVEQPDLEELVQVLPRDLLVDRLEILRAAGRVVVPLDPQLCALEERVVADLKT